MVKIRRKFLETEYGQLHVRLAGSADPGLVPLVCLHMAPQSGQEFEAFMRLAGNQRLVIAPDYPGYGDSSPITHEADVTIEAYARSIWQALDMLDGFEKVDILGYHTGSKVAIEMALQRPKCVRKLFCISLSTLTPQEYELSSPSFSPLRNDAEGSALRDWWGKLQSYYDPNMPPEALIEKFAISVKTSSRFHLGFRASHLYNAHILEKLINLRTPMTLINPNDDLQKVTPRAMKYLADCTLVERSNWLPGFLETNPSEVLDTLNASRNELKTKNNMGAIPKGSRDDISA